MRFGAAGNVNAIADYMTAAGEKRRLLTVFLYVCYTTTATELHQCITAVTLSNVTSENPNKYVNFSLSMTLHTVQWTTAAV